MMKYRGIVDWFDVEKGYGFIKCDAFDKLLFVHYSAIDTDGFKYLNQEDEVEFDVFNGNRGLQIAKVKRL